jgi:hypothetical protein
LRPKAARSMTLSRATMSNVMRIRIKIVQHSLIAIFLSNLRGFRLLFDWRACWQSNCY